MSVTASPASAAEPRITSDTQVNPQRHVLTVYSPAMRRAIRLEVLTPARSTTPRPTLYLLDGIDAGIESNFLRSTWTDQTDVVKFFKNKDVNVVMPVGGTGSFYTDWDRNDPRLGRQKWETFLTRELPPLLDARLSGNGRNAVAGVSMGATGAMLLAVRHPDLYSSVAAMSGCYPMNTALDSDTMRTSIISRGANPDNMWGPVGSKSWREHQITTSMSDLKGRAVYLSSGNGLPDLSLGVNSLAPPPLGNALEAGSNACTQNFKARASSYGISATYSFRAGLHSWPYWNAELRRAWPTLQRGLTG